MADSLDHQERPRITSLDLAQFLRDALALHSGNVTESVRVESIEPIDDCHRVRFHLTDGSIIILDPEWLVPRDYYKEPA